MAKTDIFSGDARESFALLTRIPVPAGNRSQRGARTAWFWPIVGLVVAGISGGLGWCAMALGMPAFWAAGLVLLVQALLTGAMHEDGLADTADGLWGGWTRERRLEIMKDSHIGSYGVLALSFSLLFRTSALATVLSSTPTAFFAVVIVGAGSRAAMVGVMAALPSARSGGLSATTGRPSTAHFGMAILLSAAVAFGSCGILGLVILGVTLFGAVIPGIIAKVKIGGQTGDILGASQQISEIFGLAGLVLLLP